MNYTEKSYDICADASGTHLRKKAKRLSCIEKQKHKKQRLIYELTHYHYYSQSIHCNALDESESTHVTFGHACRVQKAVKKEARRAVRRLPMDALPPKGNHYRKSYEYRWRVV